MAEREEIRCAVIASAFTSWREMAASAVGGRKPGPIAKLLASLLIPDHRRPIDAIASIDRPILILHGNADSIVPVTHGRALAAAGPTAELRELEGGDHNTLRSTHPQIDRMVVEFFRAHLVGPGEPVEPIAGPDGPTEPISGEGNP
jgi:pimeloyl-ACP methyl ester carboxylesterase